MEGTSSDGGGGGQSPTRLGGGLASSLLRVPRPMVRIRPSHPGTHRTESDEDNPDDRDCGAAAAADDFDREAPVAAHDPDHGATATAMGLPDGALGHGALSLTPSGSRRSPFQRVQGCPYAFICRRNSSGALQCGAGAGYQRPRRGFSSQTCQAVPNLILSPHRLLSDA